MNPGNADTGRNPPRPPRPPCLGLHRQNPDFAHDIMSQFVVSCSGLRPSTFSQLASCWNRFTQYIHSACHPPTPLPSTRYLSALLPTLFNSAEQTLYSSNQTNTTLLNRRQVVVSAPQLLLQNVAHVLLSTIYKNTTDDTHHILGTQQ